MTNCRSRSVCLSSFDMLDDFTFSGVVHAKNASEEGGAPDAQVFARVTTNGWKDFADIPAELLQEDDKESHEGLQTFRFRFTRSHKRVMSLELTICYEVQGRKMWDDNEGKNYVFDDIPEEMPKKNENSDHFGFGACDSISAVTRKLDTFLEIFEESVRECTSSTRYPSHGRKGSRTKK